MGETGAFERLPGGTTAALFRGFLLFMNEWIPHTGKPLARQLKGSEQGGELADSTVCGAGCLVDRRVPSQRKPARRETGEQQRKLPCALRTMAVCP